jgi:hypothetical protein
MHAKESYIDSPHHSISNDMWHTMWFLMVDKLFPLKYESLKPNEEAPDLRKKSYKPAPKKCCKQEFTS